ncbi:DUF5693 family protein [Sedimentibacter sp. MB31-C6]|uniref:DUF5693 family protein n=1 Tax=Sedimentibacter sp. MB31-C6 TaxID=3109366 RepID=UPI002DDCB7E1|nr:DUF5693 family protein [Sedimentibacter sp. MB36-C1]WSI04706.1 DUF5693 family protein [Sedimentibacter sp. MB36-C1]
MSKIKIERIVLVLICLSLIVGLVTIYQRINIEKQYKTAEVVLDFAEINKFSDSSDKELSWWFEKFKEFGVQSVSIQEETINLLIKQGYSLKAEIVSELIKDYNWEDNYSNEIITNIKDGSIDSTDAIISTESESLYNYILSGIRERYSNDFYYTYNFENTYYIVLNGTFDDVYYGNLERVINQKGDGVYEEKKVVDSRLFNIGIGYDEEKINLVKNANLDVILRPINFPTFNEKLADVYKASNEKYDLEPRLYLAHGKDVLGYPENEEFLLNYIKENNMAIGLIESSTQREHLEQDGLNKLVEDSNYNGVRVFTMWDFIRERNKYYNYEGAEEIENTMFRAITERNIRVIYFKPFFEEKGSTKYMTDVDEYERTFLSLSNRLNEHNIELGKARSIEEFHIGSKRLAILSIGVTLASVLLFIKMFNIKHRYSNFLYLLALPGALVPFVMHNIAEKGFALAAAVAFSGLSIYFLIMQIKKIMHSSKTLTNLQMMVHSIIILTISIAISLVGAVFLDAILSDVKYLLEMDIFRGVKIAQLLPFGIFAMMYLIYFMNNNEDDSLKSVVNTTIRILNKEIKIYYAIIVGIIGLVGFIYISRTGHETEIQPTNIEMISRNFMEYILLARPRTKEFLIAFPAIFAAVFAANKKSEFFAGLFMLAAAIGTSSVINTFSHIRTPIYLSLARTIIALGFGIIIGCIIILLFNWIYRIFIKVQERLQ